MTDQNSLSDKNRGGLAQVLAEDLGEKLQRTGTEALAAAKDGLHLSDSAAGTSQDAAGLIADVKAEGAQLSEAAREHAETFAESQKRVGADYAHSLATAAHRAADELNSTSPQIADYVRDAASSVDHLAKSLRDRSVGDMVGGVERFARAQPAYFFGAAVLAGFALARFAKSSPEGGDVAPSGSGTDGRIQPTI